MRDKLSLLILYDYFYPGYKAGGPVQSLTNLAIKLGKKYEIYVVTSAHDLLFIKQYDSIYINQWNEVNLPGASNTIKVFYSDKTGGKENYLQIINRTCPAVVYFNNIYSYYFFRFPLSIFKRVRGNYKIVICPRGMLQHGALAVKPLKKRIYLAYLRYSGLLDSVHWHATNQEEADDIKKYFPKNCGIDIAANIPKPPLQEIFYPVKQKSYLKLVYLSLVTKKKNLLQLLEIISSLKENIVLHIYGPITDRIYWQQCLSLIQNMPEKVQYKGEVQPSQVQHILSQYHALILLTKGENFGHAIYESFSAGRPVITSYFTPWNNLQQKMAGLNLDINDLKDCLEKLNNLVDLGQDEYNTKCEGARRLALQYYQSLETEIEYQKLFG